jgi:aryl-alcohol dehydrogenase-like predicted oxidoreductase
VEREILPWCKEHGVGVVAYSPLHRGLLTGKFSRDFINTLAEDDWRRAQNHTYFSEPMFSNVLDFVDQATPIAGKYDKTIGQLAVAWVLMHPAVTSAIAGARTVEQAKQNVSGAGWQISNEDMEKIEEIYQETVGKR